MLVVLDVGRRALAAEIARNSADPSRPSVDVQRAGTSSRVLHQSPMSSTSRPGISCSASSRAAMTARGKHLRLAQCPLGLGAELLGTHESAGVGGLNQLR